MANSGYLKFSIINETALTAYAEFINGKLLDDNQDTFCVHIFFNKPKKRFLDIHTIEPGTCSSISFPKRHHVLFAIEIDATYGKNETGDELELTLLDTSQTNQKTRN